MSRTPHLYWATYGIVINEKNQVLMLQRQNTWYNDGGRCLPAGHIDQWELASASMQHELEEEIWIKITSDDIKLVHVFHRINNQPGGSREYFDLCYVITSWTGDIINGEPEKCTDIQRFDLDKLPEYMWMENRLFLDSYAEKWLNEIVFTEMDLRE